MKVVLFCGGYGMRMRDGVSDLPKPMITIGDRPLLWHVMSYYAHFGHRDFVLCLGYGAQHIKRYFLNYEETYATDFVLSDGGRTVDVLSSDIEDWRITLVQTGLQTPIGERLRRVRPYLEDDPVFLANYADVLTDLPLSRMVAALQDSDAVASLLAVPPQAAFHVVSSDSSDRVTDIHSVSSLSMRENGGYFVFRREIFDWLDAGDDLVGDTLRRLVDQRRLLAFPYDGFWMAADTLKERAVLEDMHQRGATPWAVWEPGTQGNGDGPSAPGPNR